ncbi:MAG TPA: tetratricopeptide repeat protein [Pyrinomonadaceae bacterium]|nr:tetratricopeptide repeat protein [Pyrinomonadaceae bacterium]
MTEGMGQKIVMGKKHIITNFVNLRIALAPAALALLGFTGWSVAKLRPGSKASVAIAGSRTTTPCALALAPTPGNEGIDGEIARLQQQAKRASDPSRALEQLGWLFVKKARLSYDAGYYKLAEQCAACMETKQANSAEALLLRGHVLDSLHRFAEAEKLARELVARRGLPFDFGLLGDTLMEQGRVRDAAAAYQKMVDLRPDLQSYTRAAHVRWLTGDLKGAIELMRLAATAGSPRDPESAAWAYTRLALYELQAGEITRALAASDAALSFQTDYAAALLVCGRTLMAQGKATEAVEILKRAASLNPLPEYQWHLADALRATGNVAAAQLIEDEILQRGAVNDPRTLALYLGTRGEQPEMALRLAEEELRLRQDVFTHDALAWSLAALGRIPEASGQMKLALAEGTKDARLYFHAGVIANRLGQKHEARKWCKDAAGIAQMLLPSERTELRRQLAKL